MAAVSLLAGAVTALSAPFLLAIEVFDSGWERTAMEALSFTTSLLFIAASVRYQSRIFLYSGALFLLLLIIYLNFEHFAGDVGMPIALLISGVALIILGLGAGRLNRLIGHRAPTG